MRAERDADREAILARRALFLASTLGGLSLGADAPGGQAPGAAPAPAQPPAAPAASVDGPAGLAVPASLAPTRRVPFQICLSDDILEPPALHDPPPKRGYMGLSQRGQAVAYGHRYGAARQQGVLLGVQLQAPLFVAVPLSPQAGAPRRFAGLLGGGLGFALSAAVTASLDARASVWLESASGQAGALTQGGAGGWLHWNASRWLWMGVGAGGGYLSPAPAEGRWRLRPGSLGRLEVAAPGVRTFDGQLEFSLRAGLTWAHLSDGDRERFGLASAQAGVWMTYLFVPEGP